MNKLLAFILFFLCLNNYGQKKIYLKIIGQTDHETKIIDSISYSNSFANAKNIIDENKSFSEKLLKFGFLEHELLETKKQNDSTFLFSYNIGSQTKFVHVYIGNLFEEKNWSIYKIENDTLKIPFSESESSHAFIFSASVDSPIPWVCTVL